jgi:hypothetical protein
MKPLALPKDGLGGLSLSELVAGPREWGIRGRGKLDRPHAIRP